MGSLMGGWNSPNQDPKLVRYQRNKSMTREEINAFWRSKKKTEEEQLRATFDPSDSSSQESTPDQRPEARFQRSYTMPLVPEASFQRSNTAPLISTNEETLAGFNKTETSTKELLKQHSWWRSSSSAFLNEPPVISSESTHKYTSQFHVPSMWFAASSK